MMSCEAAPVISTYPVDIEQMNKMLEQPHWTADQWSAFCEQTSEGEGAQHCGMQVIIDCPPDCGVYALLQHDKFLRRIR
jgi:hypothetical protein